MHIVVHTNIEYDLDDIYIYTYSISEYIVRYTRIYIHVLCICIMYD